MQIGVALILFELNLFALEPNDERPDEFYV